MVCGNPKESRCFLKAYHILLAAVASLPWQHQSCISQPCLPPAYLQTLTSSCHFLWKKSSFPRVFLHSVKINPIFHPFSYSNLIGRSSQSVSLIGPFINGALFHPCEDMHFQDNSEGGSVLDLLSFSFLGQSLPKLGTLILSQWSYEWCVKEGDLDGESGCIKPYKCNFITIPRSLRASNWSRVCVVYPNAASVIWICPSYELWEYVMVLSQNGYNGDISCHKHVSQKTIAIASSHSL